MKGVACARCIDIRLLPQRDLEPVSCRCGNVTGWWVNGGRGAARYAAKHRVDAYGVGLNNRFLTVALDATRPPNWSDQDWRDLHEHACEAPGYLFDKGRRNCWLVLFKPGTVRDVEWASDEELAAVGLGDESLLDVLGIKPGQRMGGLSDREEGDVNG